MSNSRTITMAKHIARKGWKRRQRTVNGIRKFSYYHPCGVVVHSLSEAFGCRVRIYSEAKQAFFDGLESDTELDWNPYPETAYPYSLSHTNQWMTHLELCRKQAPDSKIVTLEEARKLQRKFTK